MELLKGKGNKLTQERWIRGDEWCSISSPTLNKTLAILGLGGSANTSGNVLKSLSLIFPFKPLLSLIPLLTKLQLGIDSRSTSSYGKLVILLVTVY